MTTTFVTRNGQTITWRRLRGVGKKVAKQSELEGLMWGEFIERALATRDALEHLGGDAEVSVILDDAPDDQNWVVTYQPKERQ